MAEKPADAAGSAASTASAGADAAKAKAQARKRRRQKRSSISFLPNLSLRVRTIVVFALLILALILVLLVLVGAMMSTTFVGQEISVSEKNIDRTVALFSSAREGLMTTTRDYAVWSDSVVAMDALSAGDYATYNEYLESNFQTPDGTVNTYLGFNIFGLWMANGTLAWSSYNPSTENETVSLDPSPTPPEMLETGFAHSLLQGADLWSGFLNFPNLPSMVVAIHAIQDAEGEPHHGALLFGYETKNDLQNIADITQACVTLFMPSADATTDILYEEALSESTREALAELLEHGAGNASALGEHRVIEKLRLKADERESFGRVCPEGYVESDITREAGYFLAKDPVAGHLPGPLVRIDHAREYWVTGNQSMGTMLFLMVAVIALLAIMYTVFLDRAVLQRLNRISLLLTSLGVSSGFSTPSGSSMASLQGGSTTTSSSAGGDGSSSTPSLPGSGDGSSVAASDATDGKKRHGDEINRLKRMLKYKLQLATNELAVSAVTLSNRRIVADREDSALKLHNLLCGRDAASSIPDELLPSSGKAVLVSLEGFIANPIAIEFLKAYARDYGCYESVLFLLDFLQLRRTAAEPEMQEKLAPLAAAVFRRYFSERAPLALKITRHTRRKITKAVASCKAPTAIAAYEELANEIADALRSSVLPHFSHTVGYKHMLRVLRTENGEDLTGPYYSERPAGTATPRSAGSSTQELPVVAGMQSPKQKDGSKTHNRRHSGMFGRLRDALGSSSDGSSMSSPKAAEGAAGSPPSSSSSQHHAMSPKSSRRAAGAPDDAAGTPIPLTPLASHVTTVSREDDEELPMVLQLSAVKGMAAAAAAGPRPTSAASSTAPLVVGSPLASPPAAPVAEEASESASSSSSVEVFELVEQQQQQH